MTPRLSIIAASIRRVIAALGGAATASDYYWDNVVLAMKMDTGVDPEWGSTVLAMHMDDGSGSDPYWNDVVVALHMDGADNGVVFTDEKGSSITATGGTCTKTATKKFGTASAYFGGVSEFITVNDGSKVNFGTGDFTIEGWFLFSQISSQYIFGSRNSGLLQANLHDNLANKISIRAGGSYIFGTTPIVVDTWYHIAFVRSSGTSKFYLNGGLEGTIADTNNYETSQFDIGGASSLPNHGLKGNIDDFRITKGVARYPSNFSVATSPFGSGSVFDDRKSHTITPVGTPSLSATHSKFGGKSAFFNGTTDYLTIPTSTDFGFGTGDFTVECWVKTATSGTVLDLRSSSGELGLFAISSGFISLWNGSTYLQGFTNVITDAWVHLAWVRSAGVVSMFVNGVLDGVSATSLTFGTTRPVRIGADIASANFFSGYIDDLRVSKVARYADEFTQATYKFLDGTAVPFLEEKGKAVTALGNTSISTTTKQFGSGSANFDGAADQLEIADNADFAFGINDFTIECWINLKSSLSVTGVVGQRSNSSLIGWSLQVESSNARFQYSIGGSIDGTVYNTQNLGLNTWYHLAIVRNGSLLTLFVGGVAGSSVTIGTAALYDASLPVWIGSLNQLNPTFFNFDGYIDDLRITKGVARYISNFTPPTESLATNKKTYLDPHWGKVVLGMHMDGGDNGVVFTDVKGKAVTPTSSITKTAIKKFGTASAYFDGTGDYLTVANSNDFAFGSDDFTIECWVYALSIPTASNKFAFLITHDSIGISRGWELFLNDVTGPLGFLMFSDNATYKTVMDTNPFPLNEWNHIAVSKNGPNLRLFRNGNMVAIDTTSNITIQNPNVSVLIGSNRSANVVDTSGSWNFNGYIDDLRITKGVARYTANFQPVQLPFPEKAHDPVPYVSDPYWNNVVLAMHMDGVDNGVVFTDVKGKTVTPTSAVTKTATKKFGTASAYFDGAGDYLSVPNSSDFAFGLGPFTVESWAYHVARPASAWHSIAGCFDGAAVNGWRLLVGTLGEVIFSWANSSITYGAVSATGVVPLSTWVHIAAVADGSTIKVYINGLRVITQLQTAIGAPTTALLIGANTTSTWHWNGYIDDLRITKGVARYTANFTPPAAPFQDA